MRWWAREGHGSLAAAAAALLLLSGCGPSPQGTPALPSASAPSTSASSASGSSSVPSSSASGSSPVPSSSASSASGQSSSSSGQHTTEPTAGPAPTAATANPPGNADAGPVAWVPPGPVDPADPPQNQWYALFQRMDCDGLAAAVDAGNATTADGIVLWSAATAICRAVYQGQPSGWTAAAAALPALVQPTPDRCLDRAAYDVVAGLVALHLQNPTATPSPVPGNGTACPLSLTGLDALDGTGPTVSPSSGLAGGTFQLVGRFLDVVAVLVDGQHILPAADPNLPGRWNVVLPPAPTAGAVTIMVEGSGGMVPGELTFTYVDDGATEPPGASPSSSPTDTATDATTDATTTGGG
ncbi:hypothetical protein IV498_08350 [Paenarthrobacter sp. Z7-10]|uniref:hypothetical protein n=1 Tax=Paenarthrobacter sp. Z7-10 TaxID=2787635 RepID=UPI0022A9E601|nr:hypothetical protein [Paenarthrobacter sp. Z7-10]MCZ2403191.1 hypothetical protein [Paenarthrobacter sp. Z7-10]